MKPSLTLLALDPGYDRVGWAVGVKQNGKLTQLQYGCIQTSSKNSLWQRYEQIRQELTALLEKTQPDQAALESLFFFKNQTTAMHVSEARGLMIGCLLEHKVELFEYTPLQIKQGVTGYGRADKASVAKMVKLQLPEIATTKIALIDDTLDALALLITHAASASWQKRV